MPKKRQLKVWPELVDYLPAVSPFQNFAGIDNDVRIDFSECREVTSTGATVLLLQLLSLLKGGRKDRTWETDNIDNNPAFPTIVKLGFFHHMNQHFTNSSFLTDTTFAGPFSEVDNKFYHGRRTRSFPIQRLCFDDKKDDRREAAKLFKKSVRKQLLELEQICRFPVPANQITSILHEMAKNSADHTIEDAFFGMDVVEIPELRKMELHFVFGDLGKGIKEHIHENLPQETKQRRGPKWSHYESYHFALKQGYTSTRANHRNRGLGMSIIVDGAKGAGMILSVFDAGSRGILSSIREPTHEDLRKRFIPFSKDNVFFYHALLKGGAS